MGWKEETVPQTATPPESIRLSVVLPVVDKILDRTCRRLRREDAEDLASHVRLRLIENDHAILRRFGGRSSWRTYLTVVIRRLVVDYRTHSWGKYRPSAQARRLGPAGMKLERLIQRDGFTADEAIASLEIDLRVGRSRSELRRLESLLPPVRSRRRRVDDTELLEVACDGYVEERILDAERSAAIQRAQAVLAL